MRESEIDALEFDRLQEEKALKQESSDPFSEEF
jgi:hypothetical protein